MSEILRLIYVVPLVVLNGEIEMAVFSVELI